MKKKQKEEKDRLAVCLAWHAPKRRNALEGEDGRRARFVVFALAAVGCLLALMGAVREFL